MRSFGFTHIISSYKLLLIIVVIVCGMAEVKGQRIYATDVTFTSPNGMSSLIGCGVFPLYLLPCYNTITVENPLDATKTDNSFARVKSGSGLAVGIGAYSGEIELKFPSPVAAGKTAYIRINSGNPDLLNTLLGGNLGNLLADLLGTVVLGNKYFEVGARMGTGSVNNLLSGTSQTGFSNSNIRLIKDANGFFYIAITPNVNYDRVYIKDFTNAILGLNQDSFTDVYYAFTGNNPCGQAFATGYEGTGLSLDLLGLGKAGVTNLEYAIDADTTTASEISLGALGVAGSISQIIYFESLSQPGDAFNIKIQAGTGLLNVGLFDNILIQSFNGTTLVDSKTLSSLVNANVLGLLNLGEKADVSYSPTLPIDKIKITLSSLLNVNLTQTVHLFSVTHSVPPPSFSPSNPNTYEICSGSEVNLRAITTSSNELKWYDASTGGTLLATTLHNTPYIPNQQLITSNVVFYVSAVRSGCTAESPRTPVYVTVNHVGITPGSLSICQDELNVFLPYTLPICNPTEYIISWDNINFVSSVSYAPLPVNSIPITIPDRTKIDPGTYTGKLIVKNASETSPEIPIQLTIKKTPAKPSVTLQ